MARLPLPTLPLPMLPPITPLLAPMLTLMLTSMLTSLLALPARAAPLPLVFCHENEDSYPWVMRQRDGVAGLNIQLLRQVERELGLAISFVGYPWRRCLAELAAGKVDGAFAASFKPERLAMGHYPMLDNGKPDPSRRMHTAGYSLYRLKGDNLEWDGRQFGNLRGSIGAQAAFSVVDFLREKGVSVDQGTKSPEDTLRKLLVGRVQGAALQGLRGDHALQEFPELAEKIERLPQPLEERPYYLMLSFQLTNNAPALAAAIWKTVAQVRESPAYQRSEREFIHAP